MASAPDAHADETVSTGPVVPSRRATASPGEAERVGREQAARRGRAVRVDQGVHEPLGLEQAAGAAGEEHGHVGIGQRPRQTRLAAGFERRADREPVGVRQPPPAAHGPPSRGLGGTSPATWVRWGV